MNTAICRNCGDVTLWGYFCGSCVRAFVSGIGSALAGAVLGHFLGGLR